MIIWKKIFKMSVLFHISLLFLLLLNSCSVRSGTGNGKDAGEMRNVLRQAAFVYDLDCIPLDKMVRADTLWRTPVPSETGEEPFWAYVVTGDCSYCIAEAIEFFHAYFSMDCGRELKLLIIKGDEEVFKYYMGKEDFNEVELEQLSAIPTFNIDKDSMTQDGIFLIYDKRIINHVALKS